MSELVAKFDNQHDFLTALETATAACWTVQSGVTLWFTVVSARQATLTLTLAPARHYPGMLRQILQRRFLEADALFAISLSLDEQQHLRLRRALSTLTDSVAAIDELWRLAGLPPR
ncbi:type III secretion protein [Pectobacterium odoriferum]|uniref:type III secretion protein n=1 Tax=Pectobacterium odoriferum TaxID=78398 RepID=UPI00052A9D28|nr:type III secretion protein [Pectobacterium odoriferum]AIU88633.1 type III secretion protein [Pectobacterium odoriferum]POE19041.1 type III secretion protein [Pectobacterium odoriferum]POE35911.1 type III secretion protein [Pectobacterium odoriferum]